MFEPDLDVLRRAESLFKTIILTYMGTIQCLQ